MLLPRAVVPLSSAAAGLCATALALAACGTSTDAQQDPSMTIPSSLGAASSTAASSPATAPASSATVSPTVGPTTSPTTSPAAPSTKPSSKPTAAAGRLLDFQGIHLLLPVESSDLPGIPDGLRSALAAGLKKRWDAYGDAPACEKGPVYVVNKVDTAGWASIDTWDDPGVTGPKCAGVGGGYAGFWTVVDGTWKEVIGTQELPACSTLAKYRFPVSIVGDKCAAADGSEVPYGG